MVLNSHELEVLEMLSGDRRPEWGAWVAACLESLSGAGYCTRGPDYQITDKGKLALQNFRQQDADEWIKKLPKREQDRVEKDRQWMERWGWDENG